MLHLLNKLTSLLPGLGSKEQLSEVRADSTQHSSVRPPQLFPRVPGVESHIGELHATLQQPLHVLREAGLLYPDRGKTSWTGGERGCRRGGKLIERIIKYELCKRTITAKTSLSIFSKKKKENPPYLVWWKHPSSVIIYTLMAHWYFPNLPCLLQLVMSLFFENEWRQLREKQGMWREW